LFTALASHIQRSSTDDTYIIQITAHHGTFGRRLGKTAVGYMESVSLVSSMHLFELWEIVENKKCLANYDYTNTKTSNYNYVNNYMKICN